jgi:hypothetical protein
MLTADTPGDAYERDADGFTDHVMGLSQQSPGMMSPVIDHCQRSPDGVCVL